MGYARAWTGLATAVVGVSAVAVFGLANPAAAEVSFDSQQGQRTGGARVAFRVTNESQTASITKVEVRFPSDVRLPEVYPIAVADWAPSITMTKVDGNPANDISSAVVWVTMPGKEIKPGGTSLLPLAMGPMPDREAVYLDVTQTRSDGSTETWAGVGVPAAGAQHTALKLDLVPLEPGQVPEDHHGGAATPGAEQADVAADDPVAEESTGSEGSGAVGLAVVLLIIAGLTAFALYWQRRRGPRTTDVEASPAARAFTPRNRETAAPKAAAKAAPKSPVEAPVPAVVETARVQRRTVVRTTAARKAAGRRTGARKSTGGAATVTMARRGEKASKRAGDNA